MVPIFANTSTSSREKEVLDGLVGGVVVDAWSVRCVDGSFFS